MWYEERYFSGIEGEDNVELCSHDDSNNGHGVRVGDGEASSR